MEEVEEGGEGQQYVSPLLRAVLNYRNGLTEVYEGPAADMLIKNIVVGRMAMSAVAQQQQIPQKEEEPPKSEDFRNMMQKYRDKIK